MSDVTQVTSFDPVVPYASVAAHDDYMANFVDRARWAPLTSALKLQFAQQATLQIDLLNFSGRKVEFDQPRQFPRYLDMFSESDAFHVPERLLDVVAKANCEQSWYLAVNYITGRDPAGRMDHQNQGVVSHSRVGASESYNINVARRHFLCPAAYSLLKSYLARTGSMRDYEDTSWRY